MKISNMIKRMEEALAEAEKRKALIELSGKQEHSHCIIGKQVVEWTPGKAVKPL